MHNKQVFADKLNAFYSQFDQRDVSVDQQQAIARVLRLPAEPTIVSEGDMRSLPSVMSNPGAPPVQTTSAGRASGCRATRSLQSTPRFYGGHPRKGAHRASQWKTPTVIPVPRKRSPSQLNNCRPVALTSVPFTCAERIVR